MNLSNNGMKKPHGAFAEGESEIKKYLRILKRRKILISTTFLAVFLGWLGYVILYDSYPVYSSSVLLYFQNPRTMSAVEEKGQTVNASRITFLETNSLLGQIVQELQLNFSILTPGISKDRLFSFVDVNPQSEPGLYRLLPKGRQYELYYSNPVTKVKDRLLLVFGAQDTVRIHQLAFQVNADYLATLPVKAVEFNVKNFDASIKSLRSRISYKWLDRKTLTNLSISATSASPQMAARIANTLAEKFVQFDSEIKNRKGNEVLKILEDQLQVAKQDLDDVNQRLQRFQEMNPQVSAAVPLTPVTTLQQNQNELRLKINDLKNLIARTENASTFNEQLDQSRQLVTYLLNAEGVPAATVFDQEFNALMTERNGLAGKYAPTHFLFVENENKFKALIAKVEVAARDHLTKMMDRASNLEHSISIEQQNLARLPLKQRQLSELMVEQGVKRNVFETVLTRYNQAKINSEVEVGDVFILDPAPVPPVQSRLALILKKSLLGLALALGLGLGLAIVREFFDKTVQTPEDLETRLKLPVIGSIPVIHSDSEVPENIKDLKGKRDTKLITLDYSPTLESESYRDLRTKLLFMNENKTLSSFIVTSLRPGEGKSLTASNLAITFAQQKISTLLIDGDLRRGVLHNVFGNKKKPGLSDFLISKATVDYDNLSKLIQKTIIPNLYLITAGTPIPNPTEMLGSERMSSVLEVLKSRFGMLILDTAPFQASSDAAILSTSVGGILVVVRAEYTNIEQLGRKLQEYRNIHENMLGLVLNMVKVNMKKERYQYSYYNY